MSNSTGLPSLAHKRAACLQWQLCDYKRTMQAQPVNTCSGLASSLPETTGHVLQAGTIASSYMEKVSKQISVRCHMVQDINAVEEAKKNLAARGTPLPDDYCKIVQMRNARQ